MGSNAGPKTVVESNILHYDIANTRSYVGTGRTINNIIQSSFGATTVNDPTYTNGNMGYLTFAKASSQFGIFPHFGRLLSNFTVEAWYYLNSLPPTNGSEVQAIVTQRYAPGSGDPINFSLGFNGSRINNGAYDGNINGGFYDGVNSRWQVTDGFSGSENTLIWIQSVVTYNGSTITDYKNGSALGSTTPPIATLGTSTSFNYLMRRWDDPNFIDGRLSSVRIYDRALTAKEVLQNYNAIRERYGL